METMTGKYSEEDLAFIRSHVEFPVYAALNLKIQDIHGNLIPLNLNNVQMLLEEIWLDIEKDKKGLVRLYVLKARRFGVSTWITGRFFWRTLTRDNHYTVVVTHEPQATDYLFKMQKRYYDNLLPEYKAVERYNNMRKLELNTKEGTGIDSAIRVGTANVGDFGSAMLIHDLHLSESSKYPKASQKTLETSILQCIPKIRDTAVVNESTAKGLGGEFYKGFWACRTVYEIYLDDKGNPKWKKEINPDADPNNAYASVFIPAFAFMEYRMEVPEDFKRTPEEELLVLRYNCPDEYLQWRRYTLSNECKGDINTYRQEYPHCIAGDMKIGTNHGIFPMSEVKEGMTCEYGKITKHINNGVRDVYKITTKLGYELSGTKEHLTRISPTLEFPNEFIELRHTLSQSVILQQPIFSDTYQKIEWHPLPCVTSSIFIDEKWGRFLGYFMGDGSIYKDSLSIVCNKNDTDVIQDVISLFSELFGTPHIREVGTKKGGIEIRKNNIKIKGVLSALGALRFYKEDSKMAKRKVCVPDVIWKSPKSVIREFLKGLFEADGFSGYLSPRIVFFSRYLDFIKDIQFLLLGFGITARRISIEKKGGIDKKYTYLGNELALRAEEALTFNREVGFVSKRKNGNTEKASVNSKYASRTCHLNLQDEVVNIEYVGEREVYDMQIDGEPQFGANGILVHNCAIEAFISSGTHVFSTEGIAKGKEEAMKHKIIARYECALAIGQWLARPDGELHVWEEPRPGVPYLLSADVAEGLAHGDYSDCAVWNHQTGIEVAHYHGHMNEYDFGAYLYYLALRYNNAWICPERNNHGHAVVNRIFGEFKYQWLYVEEIGDPPHIKRKRYGWLTTSKTRPQIIDNLKWQVNKGITGIRCPETFDEMLNFKRQDDGSEKADEGTFDDRVMQTAIGRYCLKALRPVLVKSNVPTTSSAVQGANNMHRPMNIVIRSGKKPPSGAFS